VSKTNVSQITDFLLEIGTVYDSSDAGSLATLAPNANVSIRARRNSVQTSYRKLYSSVPLQQYLEGLLAAVRAAHYVNPYYNATLLHQVFPTGTRDDPDSPVTYNSFLNHLVYEKVVTPSTVLIVDTTILNFYIGNYIPVARDGYISDNIYLTIGWTGGASVGVKEALPQIRPLVIVGDGAFQNCPTGLATSAALGHNSIIFLLHNDVYVIEQVEEDSSPYVNASATFFPENIIANWDYRKLAESFGADAYRVFTHRELTTAIEKGLRNQNTTTLIEVILPLRDRPTV